MPSFAPRGPPPAPAAPRGRTTPRRTRLPGGRPRAALGTGAAAEEINAGANALHGGMPMRTLSQLRSVSQHAGRARVTLPLTVYTDLIARAVPPAVASDVVLSLARAGLRDGDYAMFQRYVRLDIENGADAATAAQTRARGAALRNVGR